MQFAPTPLRAERLGRERSGRENSSFSASARLQFLSRVVKISGFASSVSIKQHHAIKLDGLRLPLDPHRRV
jgi:hypothetical protein